MAEFLFLGFFLSLFPVTIFAVISGYFIPRDYSVKLSVTLAFSIEMVWRTITNFSNYPDWLSYVSEMRCEDEAEQIWMQKGSIVPIRFKVTRSEPGRCLETLVLPGPVPVLGNRKFVLETLGSNQTRLTLIQNGTVKNPMLRSYLFFFHRWRNPVQVFVENLETKLKIESAKRTVTQITQGV